MYTHFYGDLNQDHRRVYEACMIATRPSNEIKIKKLICFETPSTTEYSFNSFPFLPNLFVNVEKTIDLKIEAIKKYKEELQPDPFPRSLKAIKNRASFWGSQMGKKFAESFMIIRNIDDF